MGIQTSEFGGFPNSLRVMADFYSVKTHENFVIHLVTDKATSKWLLGFIVCNDEPHEESAPPLFPSIFQCLIINTVITHHIFTLQRECNLLIRFSKVTQNVNINIYLLKAH